MQTTPDTIISAGNVIEGRVEGSGVTQVLGTIRGEVKLQGTLLIDAGGLVDGNVEADHIFVVGSISGEVIARDLLEVTSSAVLGGAFVTKRLVVEQGARLNTSISMTADAKPRASANTTTSSSSASFAATQVTAPEPVAQTTARTVTPAPAAPPVTPAPTPAPQSTPAGNYFNRPAINEPVSAPTPTPSVTTSASSVDQTAAVLEKAQIALANSKFRSSGDTDAIPVLQTSTTEELNPPPIPEDNFGETTPVPTPPQDFSATTPVAPPSTPSEQSPVAPEVASETETTSFNSTQSMGSPTATAEHQVETAQKKSTKKSRKRKSAVDSDSPNTSAEAMAATAPIISPSEGVSGDAKSGESMSLVFSDMLDDADGDAHAGA